MNDSGQNFLQHSVYWVSQKHRKEDQRLTDWVINTEITLLIYFAALLPSTGGGLCQGQLHYFNPAAGCWQALKGHRLTHLHWRLATYWRVSTTHIYIAGEGKPFNALTIN